MNIKQLLDDWSAGRLDVKSVSQRARDHLESKGMIKTALLGWVHENELNRLHTERIIKMHGDDYTFTSQRYEEKVLDKRTGKMKPTGEIKTKLTDAAYNYLYPDSTEFAKRKSIESYDSWSEEL